ncbi:LamG-like jellyroll fold domain-containing protein [Streptomyces sp. NPDC058195]|uniref:LamG-like jellyroll fold domain-containing protein n=1 Tax=Streptomyces sp. NPDC058195 TaxID=3346375 RepID=UPI0036E3438A
MLPLAGAAVAQAPRSVKSAAATGGSAPLSEADALAKAERTGAAVEVVSMRRESSEVFATPDGGLEAREYLRPVWVRSGDAWKRVDTDLVATGAGMVAPKSVSMGVEFSGGGDRSPLVRIARAGRTLSLSWPAPLPEPELAGAVATYPSVLPDVDLRMTAQEDGFTQLLVVKTAEAAKSPELAELRLKLATDGVEVKETAGGGLQAVDAGAKGAVFEAPKPMMWDSSTGASTAAARGVRAAAQGEDREPGAAESGKLGDVGVDIPAGQKELVLTPDADVLKGADTTYPVYIDPQWYSPRASAWTMASKYWASSPQWKFNGDPDAGMGYCDWSYCQPNDTKRLFYRIPVSKFAGKSILSAEFVVRNTWSASCSARSVELWQTKDISSSTTWNAQNASGFWMKKLASDSFAYGYSGCAAKDAEFDVKAAVQSAATSKASTMTFGLQAASETDGYAWKRFSDKAFLRVKYNRPPAQIKMSQLTMQYGGVCKAPSSAPRVRSLGLIYANGVTDPDGDSVSVQFQAKWDGGSWSPARTTSKKSGDNFSISLPTSIPKDKQVSWYARAYDGAQYSPWSHAGDATACYFFYDTTAPKSPAIASNEYPASDPADPSDPWYDGLGQYGTFTMTAGESQVTKYWYDFNVEPTGKNVLSTTGGAAKSISALPPRIGLNTLYVSSLDAAGNRSAPTGYRFRVTSGQLERASWQFDESAGAAQAQGSTPAREAVLYGGVTAGEQGASDGTALHFNGTDGYAATGVPTVNTANGFSVSTWVKLDAIPDGAAVVATQPGNYSPGFEMYYSKGYNRWVFNQYTADTADAGIARAMAPAAGDAVAGKWTHLVGVYSGSVKELRLYVDGVLAGSTPYTTAWNARRGLQIGAANLRGTVTNFFPGSIDDLRIFDKPVSATEVTRLYQHQPIGNGRTARMVFPLDEPAGATKVSGYSDTQPLTFQGGATTGNRGISGNALTLDGVDDYGKTAAPHTDTERSFSVSAWAKMPDTKPDHAAIIAAQAGTEKPGFELYYSSAYDRWAFNQYSADSADATPVRAMQADGVKAQPGQWVHLVGVHDKVADTLTLYVNGTKAGSVKLGGAWYAGGPVQVGAGRYGTNVTSYFPGQIDDVRIFDRPLAAEEVLQMGKQRPELKNRWMFEAAGTTSPVTTPDDAAGKKPLTLYGGAGIGSGWIDFGGLELNGTGAYAATDSLSVDTSGSFTVTAWAQAAASPGRPITLLSAEGAKRSAFDVTFQPDAANPEGLGRWELTLADKDATDASVVRVSSTDFDDVRDWNHLAVVYDGLNKEARLYVNGNLQEVACGDTDGNGESDDTACQDLIAWAENVLTFKAGGALQVGRAGSNAQTYFAGAVDDVWTFQGALNDSQISEMAGALFGLPTDVPAGG